MEENTLSNDLEINGSDLLLDDTSESGNNVNNGQSHHHHNHHHHHSHHHSHHRKSKRRKSKNGGAKKFSEFVSANKKPLLYIAGAIACCVALVLIGVVIDEKNNTLQDELPQESTGSFAATNSSIQMEVTFLPDDVMVSSPAAIAYYMTDDWESAVHIYKEFKTEDNRLDKGSSVKLAYKILGLPNGINVKEAELLLSEYPDFENPEVYPLSNTKTEAEIWNLKTGTQYYYKFNITLSRGSSVSAGGAFNTVEGPRFLSVEGTSNLRDIGGWKTSSGAIIKQGLLYRGCELDGAVLSNYTITQTGITTMLSTLGIKTDMDLRSSTDNKYGTDALGKSVEHIYYGAPMYVGVFAEQNKDIMRQIFSDLADESKYPVYLHCTHGLDRTGTVCYLLEALLGVSEDELLKEYSLSVMYHGNAWAMDQMLEFVDALKAYEGQNVQEKTQNYLLSIGVTPEEISAVRSIFLDM